jgi:hypothetical protein
MDYAISRNRKPSVSKSDRDQVIAYLKYAVDDVAELSPSGASLLVAAIDDLQQTPTTQAAGNDLRKPS